MDVQIVKATPEHAAELATRLRTFDLAEVLAFGAKDAGDALARSLKLSGVAYAALFDGQVAAMFGSFPTSTEELPFPGRLGCAWALTGDLVNRYPMSFWRSSKPALQLLWQDFDFLLNWVDARYTSSLRWLERLGAWTLRAYPVGADGALFHLVVLRRP